QNFQLNLPATPVTDIKVAHKDLVLSTQGRSFWILDNLTPLHQLEEQPITLFTPRDAVRSPATRGGGRGSTLQFPLPGAQIDYYLATAPTDDVVMEILDANGKLVRKFTSSTGTAADAAPAPDAADAGGGDDSEGGPRMRTGPTRLDKTPGMHRFTWDLRNPGAWMNANRPEAPNGPVAVPGKYAVRLTVGSWTATKPLTITEDPRILKSGVTVDDLREQFEHNMKVRDLVSEVNHLVARIRAAGPKAADVAAHVITPTIRYSKPELQTHITYLYSVTNGPDQKIGRDVIDRYQALRKELAQRTAEFEAMK
ncbi:MAG: hypothetical protein JWP63_1236, partial [Candidatus Solibacter sp.]|nr:hypothetical protein [Candidatus Solibacter sp.]